MDCSICLDETLGDIFSSDTVWSTTNTTELQFKLNVTIQSMLTMSSGLVNPPIDFTEDVTDGGGVGGGAKCQ